MRRNKETPTIIRELQYSLVGKDLLEDQIILTTSLGGQIIPKPIDHIVRLG